MTKKDYELIASAIREVQDNQKDSDGVGSGWIKQSAINVVIRSLADALESKNDRFDRNRFMQAAGLAYCPAKCQQCQSTPCNQE